MARAEQATTVGWRRPHVYRRHALPVPHSQEPMSVDSLPARAMRRPRRHTEWPTRSDTRTTLKKGRHRPWKRSCDVLLLLVWPWCDDVSAGPLVEGREVGAVRVAAVVL